MRSILLYKNKGTLCPDTDLISYKHEIGSPYCMAWTKHTARKTSGGKPLVMGRGRGKGNPKSDPKPGGRSDRKVVIEYSSDESLDENNPQQVEGEGAPKHVKKQIHLTLPTSPAHVMTTETFATFFINHGLMKALRKAFEKRGWSTDQMQETHHKLPEETRQESATLKVVHGQRKLRQRRPGVSGWDQSGQKNHWWCGWLRWR